MSADDFELEVDPVTGRVDIRRNGRAYAYDEEDLDIALLRVRREIGHNKEVVVIEPDGYRTRART